MTTTWRTLVAVAGAAIATSAAAETTPYYIGGVASYSYQSNVLGLADGAPVPTELGYSSKSDRIGTLSLVAGLDQAIGRQRVFGDFTLRDSSYAYNKLLNGQSHTLTAGLDWQTVERISGNVLVRSDSNLIAYGTFDRPTGTRNQVTSNSVDLAARIGVVTRVSIEAGAGYRSVDYSDPHYDPSDYNQDSLSLGMRYTPSGADYLGVTLRAAKGHYPHFGAAGTDQATDDFDRRDLDFAVYYQPSDVSNLYARATYTKLDYRVQNVFDFSGFTGAVKGTWQPTGKVNTSIEIARDRGQDLRFLTLDSSNQFTQFQSSQLATVLRLHAGYDTTAKVGLNATYTYARQSELATNVILGVPQEGTETTNQLGFGAAWTPTRTSRVGCDVFVERRRSDFIRQLNVSSNGLSCYGQLTVQP